MQFFLMFMFAMPLFSMEPTAEISNHPKPLVESILDATNGILASSPEERARFIVYDAMLTIIDQASMRASENAIFSYPTIKNNICLTNAALLYMESARLSAHIKIAHGNMNSILVAQGMKPAMNAASKVLEANIHKDTWGLTKKNISEELNALKISDVQEVGRKAWEISHRHTLAFFIEHDLRALFVQAFETTLTFLDSSLDETMIASMFSGI